MKRSSFLKSLVGAGIASLFPVGAIIAAEESLPKKPLLIQPELDRINTRRIIVHIKKQLEQLVNEKLLFSRPNTEQVRQEFAKAISEDILQVYKDKNLIKKESTVLLVGALDENTVVANVLICPTMVSESVTIDIIIGP